MIAAVSKEYAPIFCDGDLLRRVQFRSRRGFQVGHQKAFSVLENTA